MGLEEGRVKPGMFSKLRAFNMAYDEVLVYVVCVVCVWEVCVGGVRVLCSRYSPIRVPNAGAPQ